MVLSGGRTVYGLALGVLMLDTKFPRAVGDVGNAATWPFPVTYRVVPGAVPSRMAQPDVDSSLLDPFIEGVRDLEAQGVRAVITSCGFLARFQPQLAGAVSIPVYSSPLLQVPLAARTVRPGRKVGILTASAVLNERHFHGVGWSADAIPVVQCAPAEDSHFSETFVGNALEADLDVLDHEVVELTERLLHEDPDVGAIVLECANLSPFSDTVRRVAGVPVYDLFTLGMSAYTAVSNTGFASRR